jgi:hypothetical protein
MDFMIWKVDLKKKTSVTLQNNSANNIPYSWHVGSKMKIPVDRVVISSSNWDWCTRSS